MGAQMAQLFDKEMAARTHDGPPTSLDGKAAGGSYAGHEVVLPGDRLAIQITRHHQVQGAVHGDVRHWGGEGDGRAVQTHCALDLEEVAGGVCLRPLRCARSLIVVDVEATVAVTDHQVGGGGSSVLGDVNAGELRGDQLRRGTERRAGIAHVGHRTTAWANQNVEIPIRVHVEEGGRAVTPLRQIGVGVNRPAPDGCGDCPRVLHKRHAPALIADDQIQVGVGINVHEGRRALPAHVQTEEARRHQCPAGRDRRANVETVVEVAARTIALPATLPDEQVEIIVAVDVGKRGEGMGLMRPGQRQQEAIESPAGGGARADVRVLVNFTVNLADQQVQVAVSVPVRQRRGAVAC